MRESAKELLMVGLVILALLGLGGGMLGFGVYSVFAALEDRFGANVAVLVFGGLFVVGAFIGGALFSARIARKSQESFLQGLGELGDVMRGTAGVQREALRGEREAFKLAAGAQMIDARRVDKLADQKARLLVDAQRREATGPTWNRGDSREPWSDDDYQAEVPAARPPARERRAQIRYVE